MQLQSVQTIQLVWVHYLSLALGEVMYNTDTVHEMLSSILYLQRDPKNLDFNVFIKLPTSSKYVLCSLRGSPRVRIIFVFV